MQCNNMIYSVYDDEREDINNLSRMKKKTYEEVKINRSSLIPS